MKAILFAIAAGLFWGVGEVFTKAVLHTKQIGPVTAIAVRSTIALPVLWLVYLVVVKGANMEPQHWTKADPSTLWKLVLGSGLLAGAGGMVCFYTALNFGDVSRIKPIAFALAPATAVILGWLFLHEPMSARKAIAVALILGGVVLLSVK
ncbi:MAG: EamA family transporter [Phycisphaeraceae bacterium]|nr:MAG: EamA family transporter [Phycisphaeraceae bacterium]